MRGPPVFVSLLCALAFFTATPAASKDAAEAPAPDDPGLLASTQAELGQRLGASGEASSARAAGRPALAGAIQLERANLEAVEGQFERAMVLYREALTLAEAAGDRVLLARSLANAGRAAAEGGFDAALPRLARAEEEIAELPRGRERAWLAMHVARSYQWLIDRESAASSRLRLLAHALLLDARRTAVELDDAEAAAYAYGYLGALYESEGRRGEALSLTQRALLYAQRDERLAEGHRWHAQAARLHRDLGDVEAALREYAAAIERLQSQRHALAKQPGAARQAFREGPGRIYLDYVDLLLQRVGAASTATQEARDLERAQRTIERLKAAELRDYFRDGCVDAQRARRVALGDVPSRAAVLYPIVLPDRLELLLSLGGAVHRRALPVAAEALHAAVGQLEQLLQKRTTREYLRPAQRLYGWLIEPFEALLARGEIETVVFVPDAALGRVPLAALHDGEHFLVERFGVARTPGLELTDPRPLERERLEVFLGGLSRATQGFAALPYAAVELEGVREIHGGEILLDEAFDERRIRERLSAKAFNVVHLASHAKFAEDPRDSFLLTHSSRLSLDDLAEAVGVFRYRETPLELLLLSACETARGDERAALGFSGMAIKAGARSALGTLWLVNDRAAAELIVAFYRGLAGDLSRAAALRAAQRTLIARPEFRHPAYWSAFVLIGNWL